MGLHQSDKLAEIHTAAQQANAADRERPCSCCDVKVLARPPPG